eukprot:gb/GEZN01002940.1/.p1 GENE.gb/GEZN01002940.1/~~gb/GEZN01002940.1/.p1  ORF type:complete len:660 (-),score=137.50 gb/GEZN01002940.1/:239-2218(-)
MSEEEPKMSKSQQKKLEKEKKKAEAAAAKTAGKVTKGVPEPTKKKVADEEEVMDEAGYYAFRQHQLHELEKKGTGSYPHKFACDMSIPEFRVMCEPLADGQEKEDKTYNVAGRVTSKRAQGAMVFWDITADGGKIQVVAFKNKVKQDFEFYGNIRRGDLIGVTGTAGKAKKGEISIFVQTVTLLAPCLKTLPPAASGLKDKETRYRQRYLDLIMNPKVRTIFETRAKIVAHVRRFLDSRGFLEVETPMLNMTAGGAIAKPFITTHNDLNIEMYCRIAPELYLKQLVVGGLDRVYEIGRQFRNECIDMTHNPEFTTCEFYWAYKDYKDLMEITEQMVSEMVLQIFGTYEVTYIPEKDGKVFDPVVVNFKPPFKRIKMVSGLEEKLKVKFPKDLYSEETKKMLSDLCTKYEVKCPEPRTVARLLDKLVGEFLENQQPHPTFIIDHPAVMSPLAKNHRDDPQLTERFELFILGSEVCNSYTELNNPMTQRERFKDQAKQSQEGDDEAMEYDEDFCTALDYGLPPTAGWGMGIDRMTMFLTQTVNIKEVLLFPAMKPKEESDTPAPGAIGATMAADDIGRKTLNRVLPTLYQVLPELETMSALLVSYAKQVVAGTNYFIKAKFTSTGGKENYHHLRVHVDLQGKYSLAGMQSGKAKKDPIVYF